MYRSSPTHNARFDAWVRLRERRFTVVTLHGDDVRNGAIELSLTVDLTGRVPARGYAGKAVFECVQNRYVFLQFGHIT